MKWLTIDLIKEHCRIDGDDQNTVLKLYGEAAEEAVLNLCNRTMEDVLEEYGTVPKDLYVAALLQVEESYNHRSAVSQQQLYDAPGFSRCIKPYVKL